MEIRPARTEDRMAIARLLREVGLPSEDFAPHLERFFVVTGGGQVLAAIGAEVAGEDALLRSLVVAPELRGRGWGDRLLAAIDAAAENGEVRRWWLLTTTAEAFFRKRGFRRAARDEAPPAIAATREFRELCPSLAACLVRERRRA